MFFLASTYIPSIAQVHGYVYFEANSGCSSYESALHATPISGVEVYGGISGAGGGGPVGGWGTSSFITGKDGYYIVGAGCKESKKPPLSFAEILSPKATVGPQPYYTGSCSYYGNEYDFWLTQPMLKSAREKRLN